MKLFFLFKLALARIWRNIYGPIIEINIDEIYDRMADPMFNHYLLNLFNLNDVDSSIFCQKYNQELYQLQNGNWLKKIIGKSKNIPYWVTPWGGCVKDYSQKRRLTLAYSIDYVKKLKEIRDSIAQKGYLPDEYGNVTGELLLNEKGERRFIIWNGHRRILSLVNLGYKKVKVEISGGDRWEGRIKKHTMKSSEFKKWPNVTNNIYSKKEALIFFNCFFD